MKHLLFAALFLLEILMALFVGRTTITDSWHVRVERPWLAIPLLLMASYAFVSTLLEKNPA